MWSNPFLVICHLQVLIYYLQSIVYQMEKGKFANIGFAIKENPLRRPLEDMMGSLSPFISTKMLVVID